MVSDIKMFPKNEDVDLTKFVLTYLELYIQPIAR
jgi:hypothetical protein